MQLPPQAAGAVFDVLVAALLGGGAPVAAASALALLLLVAAVDKREKSCRRRRKCSGSGAHPETQELASQRRHEKVGAGPVGFRQEF